MEKIPIPLQPRAPHSLRYFVPHSGVSEAVAVCQLAADSLRSNPGSSYFIFLQGGRGLGKTHLSQGYREYVGLNRSPICNFQSYELDGEDDVVSSDAAVREFISHFERLKTEGGLFFCCSRRSSEEISDNPHILSRLRSMTQVVVSSPQELELEPLLLSLLERRNLKLSSRNLGYLLSHIPQNPLSFAVVSARISQLSLTKGKPATFSLIVEALRDIETTLIQP